MNGRGVEARVRVRADWTSDEWTRSRGESESESESERGSLPG